MDDPLSHRLRVFERRPSQAFVAPVRVWVWHMGRKVAVHSRHSLQRTCNMHSGFYTQARGTIALTDTHTNSGI